MIKVLSHEESVSEFDAMTRPQRDRVIQRMLAYRSAFHDIRDAERQAVAEELDCILMNTIMTEMPFRQPDDPGFDEFPEPDVGKYPGWLTAIIWMSIPTAFWGLVFWHFST